MSGLSDRIFEQAVKAIRYKDFAEAERQLQEFIKLEPNASDAWILRGNVLTSQKRYFDAVLHYDRALSIRDDLRDAWNNRGSCFANMGMWQEAERSFGRSIAIVDTADPHIGLANLYHAIAKLPESERELRRALELDPTAGLHFQLGLVLLGQGRWQEALEQYEYRWMDNPSPPRALNALPRWQGEPLAGKSILLCPEQGYGDEIMAYRFADKALLGASRVVLQARGPLIEIAKALTFPVDEVRPLHAELPRDVDYACALLDVPRYLKMGPFDVPRPERYIRVPHPQRVAYWQQKLRPGFNVGVCWSSGSSYGMTAEGQALKSFPVGFLSILKRPGVNFVSLQKVRWEEIPPDLAMDDWMSEVEDFADTAAMIEALDLVVTVDTAVAHIAGALGKPVLNLVRFAGFFPWLHPDAAPSPDYSIWYPSMLLYRQPRLGDWVEPLERAANFIAAKVDRRV